MASDQASSVNTLTNEETSSSALSETKSYVTLNLDLQWDGPTDPDNPKNWPMPNRVISALIIASVGVLSSFAASILVPANSNVMQQFGVTDPVIGTLTTSLYVLGLGFGPFVLAPLSELYGRWIVYTSALAVYTLLQMGCALSNSMTLLIILRFLAGVTGSVAPSLGQASMSDIWDVKERGSWAAVLSLGPMIGPPVGNCVAALILSGKSWPWIFWIMMILSGFLLIFTTFVLRETYAPVILVRRQKKRIIMAGGLWPEQSSPGTLEAKKILDNEDSRGAAGMIGHAITRPLRFLCTSPILVIVSCFLAYTYGLLFLILTSLPLLFGKDQRHPDLFNYGFNKAETGLTFLGLAIGTFVGCLGQMYSQTQIWKRLTKRNGEGRPEYRLLPMVVGTIFFPVSLLWYGWSAEVGAPWIVPVLATGFFGWGMYIIFQSISVYTVEAFIPYSASAIGAATLLRCLAGGVFPLFGQQLFKHLGYGKGGTVLAVLALPAIPLPWLLYWHGTYLRKRWEFTP